MKVLLYQQSRLVRNVFFFFYYFQIKSQRTIRVSCAQINDLFRSLYLTHNDDLFFRMSIHFFILSLTRCRLTQRNYDQLTQNISDSIMMNVGGMIHASLLMLHKSINDNKIWVFFLAKNWHICKMRTNKKYEKSGINDD